MKAIAFYKSGGTIGEDWILEVKEPKSENDPVVGNDEDIVVILHASQSPEGETHTFNENNKYKCFEACINALSDGEAKDEKYRNHQKWLIKHKSNIKAIVLTSGDSNYDKKVINNAQSKLKAEDIPVDFLSISNISKLKNADSLLKIANEQNFREIALQTLQALFPYCEPSAQDSSNLNLGEPEFNSFEDFVAHRLNERLSGQENEWNTSDYNSQVVQVNMRLFQNRDYTDRWEIDKKKVPTTLDKVIALLADISRKEELERDRKEELWNKYLRALRAALIMEAN